MKQTEAVGDRARRSRRAMLTLGISAAIMACTTALASVAWGAAPEGTGRGSRPVPRLTITAPAPSPSTCSAMLLGTRWYCRTGISALRNQAYGAGSPVVLVGVSVTSQTSSSVTVAELEWPVCPPGHFCGALATTVYLTVPWPRHVQRPEVGSAIDLYGVATTGNLRPTAVRASDACYIDWC